VERCAKCVPVLDPRLADQRSCVGFGQQFDGEHTDGRVRRKTCELECRLYFRASPTHLSFDKKRRAPASPRTLDVQATQVDLDVAFGACIRLHYAAVQDNPDFCVRRIWQYSTQTDIRAGVRRAYTDGVVRFDAHRADQLWGRMLDSLQPQGLAETSLGGGPQRIGGGAAIVPGADLIGEEREQLRRSGVSVRRQR
jgi:hypothetical protein